MSASWDVGEWPSAAAPRRDVRRTHRQAALFDELVAVFLADGFADLTISDLAARLRCSKSTLYALAGSKEQLAVAVVVHFFRTATERVEASLAEVDDPAERVGCYLAAVADQLRPASTAFRRDLAEFPPARAVYEFNTRVAAGRIRALVTEGVQQGAFRDADAGFVGQVATLVMVAIQQGSLTDSTGLDDAQAYAELATFLIHGLRKQEERERVSSGGSRLDHLATRP